MSITPIMRSIPVSRIFLDLENPRHDPYESEAQVIDYLCRYENVYPLAKDIAENGLNPLELPAVIDDDEAKNSRRTYIIAEGNRRLCALKLLNDPDRAPSKLKKSFESLAKDWEGPTTLNCMVFEDREAVRMWLIRIHEGEQGGIGRKKWNADQTARFSGDNKNKTALALLDYAEKMSFITAEARKGKLTTVQRYLSNPLVRKAFGIEVGNTGELMRSRTKEDFDILISKFMLDLESGHVNSRKNKDHQDAYSRELGAIKGQSLEEITPEPLDAPAKKAKPANASRARPAKRKSIQYLPFDEDIIAALEQLDGEKLPSIYTSICSVSLQSHTPLVAIGVWAFIESLSARAGRGAGTDFLSFFSKSRLQSYGLSTGKGDKAIIEALRRVSTSGDVTKHDGKAAFFNGDQLANDMETLKDLLLKCAEEAQ